MKYQRVVVVAAGVLSFCACLPASAAELLVTSWNGNRVGRFSMTGTFIANLESGGMSHPLCTRVGPDGLLYVASEGNHSIKRYNAATGAFIDNFIPSGSGGLTSPTGLTWGGDGNLYVSSFDGNSVLRYNGTTGAFIDTFITTGLGGLNGADNGTIFGPDGNLYVPSYNNNRILKYSGTDGSFIGIFASINKPRVLEFRGSSLYVTSETADAVARYDATTGASQGTFVTAHSGGLDEPIGMAFGNDGFLYVTSGSNNRVFRYNDTTGAFVDILIPTGTGGISGPTFVTVVVPTPGAGALAIIGLAMAGRRRTR
ncbi:MAG TPA: NHL repeat-containing protein [Phycisphaerales bacterium]|nr:NHL repeat-containing protein [Phycisphaerales bacterium]